MDSVVWRGDGALAHPQVEVCMKPSGLGGDLGEKRQSFSLNLHRKKAGPGERNPSIPEVDRKNQISPSFLPPSNTGGIPAVSGEHRKQGILGGGSTFIEK